VLLNENACAHSIPHPSETFRKLKFAAMAHLLYSSNLAPFEYNWFGPLKEALMSCRLTLGQKTKEVVHVWLAVPAETVLF
jgi:hypothetical protein